MSADVHPTYQDTSEEIMRAAQKAILKPVKVADAGAKPSQTGSAKKLQEQLQTEFSDSESASSALKSTDRDVMRQAVLIAMIAAATWVLGFLLYANI